MLSNLRKGLYKINEGLNILKSGSSEFYINLTISQINMLFERFCPFKIGDLVKLTKNPKIDDKHSPGWKHCKHYLKKGTIGKVHSRTTRGDLFEFDLTFEDESWIDIEGTIHSTPHRHTYNFTEDYLERA